MLAPSQSPFFHSRAGARRIWSASLILLAAVLLPAARGDDGPSESSIQVRRVYVPADRIDQYPAGNSVYVPIDATEFERRFGAAQARPARPAPADASVEAAVYTMRLADNDVLSGDATLRIALAGSEPTMLPLDPLALGVRNPAWDAPADKAATPTVAKKPGAALFGAFGGGPAMVLVERSGALKFDWSLQGQTDASGVKTFAFALPPAAVNQLTLELAAAWTPLVDRGLVEPEPAEMPAAGSTEPRLRRWKISLGAANRFLLRLVPEGGGQRRRLTLLRQTETYDLSPRGATLTVAMKLDVLGDPIRKLRLSLDPALSLTAARLGDANLSWFITSAADMSAAETADGRQHVVVELPELLDGVDQELHLTALGPVELGRRWKLPAIRGERMVWLDQSTTVRVAAPLVIENLTPAAARQTKVAPLSPPQVGETIELHRAAADSEIEVQIDRRDDLAQVASGMTFDLDGSRLRPAGVVAQGIFAQGIFEFSIVGGERFTLEADAAEPPDVPKPWVIDTVQTLPADPAPLNWTFNASDRPHKLIVRLTKPLAPGQPLRVVVTGHRNSPPGPTILKARDLSWLTFRDAAPTRQLAAVQSKETQQLKVTASELHSRLEPLARLDSRQLDAADRALLGDVAGGMVFLLDAASANAKITAEKQPPRFSAEIHSVAEVQNGLILESHAFSITPESGLLQRLLFHFSQARDEPLHWTVEQAAEPPVARRLSTDEQAALHWDAGGESWELSLAQPLRDAVQVRASRQTAFKGETPVVLAYVAVRAADGPIDSQAAAATATAQRGVVEIRADGEARPTIDNRQLKAVPPAAPAAEQYSNLLGAYRYEPNATRSSASAPALVLTPGDGAGQQLAWAWRSSVTTRCALAGNLEHGVSYWIENRGQRRVRVSWPANATLEHVAVDTQSVSLRGDSGGGEPSAGSLWIELPAGRRFVTVTAYFSTPAVNLSVMGVIEPLWPALDIPVLARRAVLWLPPGLETASSGGRLLDPSNGWSPRLFGPLARLDGQQPFDPLAGRDWRRLGRLTPDRTVARRQLEPLVTALGVACHDHRTSRGQLQRATWGTALADAWQQFSSEAESNAATGARSLWIDAPSLARLDLTADSQAMADLSGDPADVGAAQLSGANLMFAVDADAIVLTTRAKLVGDDSPKSAARYDWFAEIGPGTLQQQVQQALRDPKTGPLVSLDDWRSASDHAVDDPWDAASPALVEWNVNRGWKAYSFDFLGEDPPRVRLVNATARTALAWALFLIALGVGWWKLAARPAAWCASLGVVGVAALVAPQVAAPIFSALFLGLLLSPVLARLAAFRPRPAAVEGPVGARFEPHPEGTTTATAIVATLLLLGFFVFSPSVRAANPATPPPAVTAAETDAKAAANVYSVLIPVDDAGKPTGKYYYIPETLFQTLRRAVSPAPGKPAWMLTDAIYRSSIENTQGKLVADEVRAEFALQTFVPDTRVEFTFGGEGARLLPGSVRLDGKPLALEAAEDNGRLAFIAPAHGSHRLEIGLRPAVQTFGALAGFDLALPPLAAARAELAAPAGLAVEIVAAQGGSTLSPRQPRLSAALGPADRLQVRWPPGEALLAAAPKVKADELLWLRLQPGSSLLDARLRYQAAGGRLPRIRLAVDSHLRLLPHSPASPVHVSTKAGDPQIITLDFGPTAGEKAEVDLSFLIPATADGTPLHLPRIETLGAKLGKRLLAVSLDPGLEETTSKEFRPLAAADFGAAWGGNPTPPSLAYTMPANRKVDWSIAVRPRAAKLTARQTVAVAVEAQRIRLGFEASLEVSGGYVYQYRVAAPKAFDIERVSVREGTVERAAHWSRDDSGALTVFLSAPGYGEQKLSLVGAIARQNQRQTWKVPALRVDTAKVESTAVLIFRRPEVLVSIADPAGLGREPPTEAAAQVGDAATSGLISAATARQDRLVECLAGNRPSPEPTLAIAPNKPNVSVEQSLAISRSGDVWQAELDFYARVNNGLVDAFYFSVAPSWQGPFQVDPMVETRLVDVPGETNRLLVVRPASPVAGAFHLRISGPVAVAAGERIRVPEVVPTQVAEARQFVVLPKQVELQQLRWEPHDLEAPRGLLPKSLFPGGHASTVMVYEAHGDHYRAQLQSIERIVGLPQVSLAEISLAWAADGRFVGVATFDLEPAGLTSCILQLPPSCKLVHATVAGLPANLTPDAADRWSLTLGPDQLPQSIEVLFSGTLPEAGSTPEHRRFEAPTLVGLPVARTLWTIYAAPGWAAGYAEGATLLDPIRQQQFRLDSTAALVDAAAATGVEEPVEEVDRWYQPWIAKLVARRNELQRRGVFETSETDRRDTAQRIAQLDSDQLKLATRLGAASAWESANTAPRRLLDTSDLWNWSLDRDQPPLLCMVHGASGSLAVQYDQSRSDNLPQRGVAALLLALIAGFGVMAIVNGSAALWWERWPYAAGVAVGLGWWLLLSPSWFGWLIVLGSLIAALRPAWRAPTEPVANDVHSVISS